MLLRKPRIMEAFGWITKAVRLPDSTRSICRYHPSMPSYWVCTQTSTTTRPTSTPFSLMQRSEENPYRPRKKAYLSYGTAGTSMSARAILMTGLAVPTTKPCQQSNSPTTKASVPVRFVHCSILSRPHYPWLTRLPMRRWYRTTDVWKTVSMWQQPQKRSVIE